MRRRPRAAGPRRRLRRKRRTEPAYALEDVVGGESATEIEVPLDDLFAGGYAVSVHETPALLRIRAACGEIPREDAS